MLSDLSRDTEPPPPSGSRGGSLFAAYPLGGDRFAIVTPSGRRIELDRQDVRRLVDVARR